MSQEISAVVETLNVETPKLKVTSHYRIEVNSFEDESSNSDFSEDISGKKII